METPVEEYRLFIALPARPAPRLKAIVQRLGTMGRAVRPVHVDQLHLTLKFLGEIKVEAIDAVRETLENVARATPRFCWSIQGLGAFPNAARPRVVWAGCIPPEPLIALASAIENGLATRGFKRDRKIFQPHLTLARVHGKAPPELRELLNNTDSVTLSEQSAKSIILYRSILGGGRATHQPIHEARLARP